MIDLRTFLLAMLTRVIDARDSTFAGPGRFGVWTKADSRIQFDDLTATPR